ncbi:hypothetical protein [Micromonospora sp. NBC_01813]|uniref:hypothetical protein n=1 Tax=Micromonospora sp. NBC_01813 TaxID=2975988 RepID=UPI002DDADD00|nr:hypothetical protein [Micromonospora sp. NBC_01813]WSA07534.1 hypothetical protein OG958_25285 [Micromonospora sp. NBC_01813]
MTDAYTVAPLPSCPPGGDRAGVAEGIAAWLGSAAMTALLDAFGFRLPTAGPLADRLTDAARFSARWDYRKGMERHQAVGETFEPELDALIRQATAALGLADCSTPAAQRYDHVLVLGAGVRTMLARADLAATVLRAGIGVSTVVGLGSTRPLVGHAETTRELGLRPCPTEGDAVEASLRREFGLGEPTSRRDGDGWWVREHAYARPPVSVLAAPSTRPGMRANTADTLVGWADLLPGAVRGARLLLVTTDMFVPFQHCDAVRVLGLGYGAMIETIGFATATSRWVPPADTFEVLQEVRSAIHSMQLLYAAVD